MNNNLQNRIVAKAVTLFCRNGIKSVTMDQVASEIGISKRTLYENFKDKDELCLAVADVINSEHDVQAKEEISKSKNTLEAMLRIYRRSFKKMQFINRNYFLDMKRYYPDVFNVSQREHEKRQKECALFLERGKEEGMIRKDLKNEVVAALITSQINYLLNSDDIASGKFTFIDVYETVFTNFIRGIATQDGVKFIDDFMVDIANE
ncbi:MAG: TetR/AcrR family transcriptional regulator [Bacteroidales bacterium]